MRPPRSAAIFPLACSVLGLAGLVVLLSGGGGEGRGFLRPGENAPGWGRVAPFSGTAVGGTGGGTERILIDDRPPSKRVPLRPGPRGGTLRDSTKKGSGPGSPSGRSFFIAGKAVYPNGMAAAGMRLGAFYSPSGIPRRFRNPTNSKETRWETKSGRDGRFLFKGLPEEGFYGIAWYGGGGCGLFCGYFRGYICGYSDLLFETGRRDALIVVKEYRVHLRVRDDAGKPLPGARYTLLSADQREGRFQWDSAWGRASAAGAGGEAYIEGNAEEDGLLHPGDRVALCAWTKEFFPRVKETVIVEGFFETVVDLFLGPAAPPGRLKLRIPASNGIGVSVDEGGFFSRDSFVPMERFALEKEKGKDCVRVFSLPPGNYTMVLLVYDPAIDLFYPLSRDIDVLPGEEVALSIGPRRGGRIRLVAYPPPGMEDFSPPLKKISLRSLRDDREAAFDSRTFFFGPRGGCCFCCFEGDLEGLTKPGGPFPPSRCFEPGWYRLQVEFAGCLPAAQNLYLGPGETRDAVLHLLSESP